MAAAEGEADEGPVLPADAGVHRHGRGHRRDIRGIQREQGRMT